MPPKKNATPAKQPEDSSVTFDESEDMSFQLSRVEGLVKGLVSKGELDQSINKLRGDLEKNMKGSVKIGDLANLQVEIAESMGNMEKKLGGRIEIIVNLIQHPEEKLPNDDNVGKVLMMKEIVLILRNHPLVSLLLEGSILTLKVIKDGSQGVFNFPRLT